MLCKILSGFSLGGGVDLYPGDEAVEVPDNQVAALVRRGKVELVGSEQPPVADGGLTTASLANPARPRKGN